MLERIKLRITVGKHKTERLYAVLATFCALAGGYKLLTLPLVNISNHAVPIWQFVGGILIAEVAYHIYAMTEVQ